MEIKTLTCDICKSELPRKNSSIGNTLNLKVILEKAQEFWFFKYCKRETCKYDICSDCLNFIFALTIENEPFLALQKIYEAYLDMSIADRKIFNEELLQKVKTIKGEK